MARPHHQTALRDQHGGPERHFVGAEQRCNDDVPPGLHTPVDAQPDAASQAALDKDALRLRQAKLPRKPGMLDRGQRARARAALGARDVDHVRERLRDTRGDNPYA